MRFATVGTSEIVELFCAAVDRVDEVQHTVVHSRDQARAESFAAPRGARAVDSLEALAGADDVDAVYVASPNALHHQQARAMLLAGKHVLVEKSACSTAEQWQDLVQLARERNLVLLESVRAVHEPSWRLVESHLDSLGPIRQVNLQMCQRSRRYDNYLAGRVENIFRPEMAAGALMDLGVYCLHPLTLLFGLPSRVRASSVLLPNGIDGATTLLLDYPDFTATVTCSKVSANSSWNVVAGEDASLELDAIAAPQRMRLWWSHSRSFEELEVDTSLPQQAHVLRAFCRMVEDPRLAARFQRATLEALTVTDEARRQVGVQFPADPD